MNGVTLKVGETVYRVFNPEDGGGYFAQSLKVLEVNADCVVFRLFDGSSLVLPRAEECKLYTSKFECSKECWELNGTGDPFEQLCRRQGIVSEQAKAKELKYQMEIWGAVDYDDLLHCLV